VIKGQPVPRAWKLRYGRQEPTLPRQQWDDLVPMLESGALDPPIGSVFSLDEVSEAIRTLDERRATGKVLVRVRRRGGAA
jgi:NADPH:quinone reductase